MYCNSVILLQQVTVLQSAMTGFNDSVRSEFAELWSNVSQVRTTVEPLNNVTFGTSYSVHYYREVALFGGYKCVSTIGK